MSTAQKKAIILKTTCYKRMRQETGYTQETAAELLDIGLRTLQSYECFFLRIPTVRKVCGGNQPATAGF